MRRAGDLVGVIGLQLEQSVFAPSGLGNFLFAVRPFHEDHATILSKARRDFPQRLGN